MAFRWPITATVTIDAPADIVWEAISAPGGLESCHPYCRRNPVTHWPGADAVDEVHYLNGVVYERRFRDWHEGRGFDLEIWHKEKSLAGVSWRIAPLDERLSTLQITVCPSALQQVPAAVRWIPHWLFLRPKLASYLKSVVRGYEWYITKGEPVPRNQFGTHPWYS